MILDKVLSDFIEYLLSQTGETMDYYTQELGMQGSMTQQGATRRYGNTLLGGSRFGAGVVDALAAHLAEKGVTVVLDATANEIVMEDGKAVGIKATAPGGDFTVRADKVILATGGANYNSELMTSVTPSMNYMTIDHQSLVGNTGDGWAAPRRERQGGRRSVPHWLPRLPMRACSATWQNTPNLNSQLIFDANGVRYVREDQGVS
ncbi:MAG: FAD-binding protein [Christensenellales bacterium]